MVGQSPELTHVAVIVRTEQNQNKLYLRNLTDTKLVFEEVICADQAKKLIHFYIMQTEMRNFWLFTVTTNKQNSFFFFFFC